MHPPSTGARNAVYGAKMGRALKQTSGEVMRNLRLERGMSQDELGLAAGVPRPYIGLIERGNRGLTLEMLFRLASALGVSVSTIMQRIESILMTKGTF